MHACFVMLIAGPVLADAPDSATCNIQKGPCVAFTASGMEVYFWITPRPVKAMQDVEFAVMLKRKGKPVTGASVAIDLTMPGMYMARNQPKLTEEAPGTYRGRGVMPRCASGRRIWKASITVGRTIPTEGADFRFEVW